MTAVQRTCEALSANVEGPPEGAEKLLATAAAAHAAVRGHPGGAFVLLICALPLGISGFLLCWLDLPQKTKTLFSHFARLSLSVSSSAEPVVYFVEGGRGRPSLREPLGAALRRALQEEPEPEDGQTLSTGTNDEVGV
eukprot:bmy_17676T0